MAKKIEMKVSPTGEVTITTSGYRGAECKKATKELEEALGTVTKDTPTPEAALKEAKTNVEAR